MKPLTRISPIDQIVTLPLLQIISKKGFKISCFTH